MDIKTKANIGDTILYIDDNSICSSDVLSIKVVVNTPKGVERAATPEQQKIWTAFGKDGIWYSTVHGQYHEDHVYLSREALAKAIAEGTFKNRPGEN